MNLVCCPLCSSPGRRGVHQPVIIGPQWFYCHNVSRRDKVSTYLWTPMCAHAEGISSGFVQDAERERPSKIWNNRADMLLAERTADWPPAAKGALRALVFPVDTGAPTALS